MQNWSVLSIESAFGATLPALTQGQRAHQSSSTPSSPSPFQSRKVQDYFTSSPKHLKREHLNRLEQDVSSLLEEYAKGSTNAGDIISFMHNYMSPFIQHLTPDLVSEIGQWTLDQLVTVHLLNYKMAGAQAQNDPSTLLQWIDDAIHGRTLHNLSYEGIFILVMFGGWLLKSTVSFLGLALAAGPGATIANSASEPVVTPINQWVKMWAQRLIGRTKVPIQDFLNKARPPNGHDTARGWKIRVPHRHIDGIDFAGMTPYEQHLNMEELKRMWVRVQTTFGQLFPDDYHHGRGLVTEAFMRAVRYSQASEVMKSKLLLLQMRSEQIIQSRLNRMPKGTSVTVMADEIQALLQHMKGLYQQRARADLTHEGSEMLNRRIARAIQNLQDFGFTHAEAQALAENEIIRLRALKSLSTIVTLQNLDTFGHPENNRNLTEQARRMQQVMYEGLGLQADTDDLESSVQELLREMGLHAGGPPHQQRTYGEANFNGCLERELGAVDPTTHQCAAAFANQNLNEQSTPHESIVARPSEPEIDAIQIQILEDPNTSFFPLLSSITNPEMKMLLSRFIAEQIAAKRISEDKLLSKMEEVILACAE